MKYCTHCGNQLIDDAVICPQCGCPTESYQQPNYSAPQYNNRQKPLGALTIVGFVFAFIIPLVGLICSILAYKSATAELNDRARTFAKAGIIIAAIFLGIEILSYAILIISGIISYGVGVFSNYIY